MPIEQEQLAREAVKSVASEVQQSRKDERMQRATEHAIQRAQQQTNPDLALRALAYGEKEGWRRTKAWGEATAKVDTWRQKSKLKTPSRFRVINEHRSGKTWGESVEAVQKQGLFNRAAQEKLHQERTEIRQAKKELASVDANHKDQIDQEERRIIGEMIKTNKRELQPHELDKARMDARNNVAAALQLEEMQREEMRKEMTTNPLVDKLLLDRIIEEQQTSRKPITLEWKQEMRDKIVSELTDQSMDRLQDTEAKLRLDEQRLTSHEDFTNNFIKALNGVDVTMATPEQVQKAREKAIEMTRKKVEEQENDAKQKIDNEIQKMRHTDEWKKAYAKVLLAEGATLSKAELEEAADREARVQIVENGLVAANNEVAEKQQQKAEIDARVLIAQLQLDIIDANDALNSASSPEDKNTRTTALNEANSKLAKALDKANTDAVRERQLAAANPSDKNRENRAKLLEKRAADLQKLSADLASKTRDDVENALNDEKDKQVQVQGEIAIAKKSVVGAELQVKLIKNTDIPLHDIPSNITEITPAIAEKLSEALSAGSPEQQKQSLLAVKEKLEKNRSTFGSVVALALILAVLTGLSGSIGTGNN